MYILYFDEAGCTASVPDVSSPISPMLVITGLIIRADYIPYITKNFMDLKKEYLETPLTNSSGFIIQIG